MCCWIHDRETCPFTWLGRTDLEGELVVADADHVAVAERRRAADPLSPDVDAVGRAQVGDDEAGAGVDDDGVMAADVDVVEHDVVVGQPSDPGGDRGQGMAGPDANRRNATGVWLPTAVRTSIELILCTAVVCAAFRTFSGSWRRIRSCRARTVGPGSMPRSSARVVFSRWKASSASDCRSAR